jgi:hypothetical protein
MQMLSSLLCLLIGGFLLVTEALPLVKLTGSELLAAQLGESESLLARPELLDGGLIPDSCETYVNAEQTGAPELRLFLQVVPTLTFLAAIWASDCAFLQAVRDANSDLTDVACVHVRFPDALIALLRFPIASRRVSYSRQVAKQVTKREIVEMKVAGTSTADQTVVTRLCRVERLRTTAGGRDKEFEPSKQITAAGDSSLTDAEADKIKERNRYRVDACTPVESDETMNIDIHVPAEPSYALGKPTVLVSTSRVVSISWAQHTCAQV